jgi:hypothetical protein
MEREKTYTEELVYGMYKHIHIAEFVRDLILYGAARVVEVCDNHKVSAKEFQEIVELPSFKKEMREIRALVEASPNALIQLKARMVAEEALDSLHDIVKRGDRDNERINAAKLVFQVAGVMDTGRQSSGEEGGKPQASGLVLNVNLGAGGSLIPPLPTGEQRPLRRVSAISRAVEVENVK